MPIVLGLVSFVLLLSCLVILRERRLRRGWQRLLECVLKERIRYAADQKPSPPGPRADERL